VKFKHPTNSRFATPEIKNEAAQTALQWDLIAIKSAIEFCLAINSTSLLFSDIFNLFAQSGLEEKFLKNLEPFIL
jgi:alpha-tubulin suppressor-like RCC1 family protein